MGSHPCRAYTVIGLAQYTNLEKKIQSLTTNNTATRNPGNLLILSRRSPMKNTKSRRSRKKKVCLREYMNFHLMRCLMMSLRFLKGDTDTR